MIKINIRKSEKCADATSIFVSFPYDKLLVDMIKSFPIKYWNNDNKEWELPTSTLEEVISKFNNYAIDIQADASELVRLMNVNYELPTEFEYKTKPFEHQKIGFDYGLTHDRWLLGDEQGLGKALALSTKVYTPSGYKLMRDIQVGDYVFGKDGRPTKVTAVYNHSNVDMYKITFSDGVSIECCKDHLWEINDQHGKKVVDTEWFTKKDQFGRVRKDNLFSTGSKSYKYWIDRCEPIQFDYQNIPIDPYVIGVLLGDGCITGGVSLTSYDQDIIDAVNSKLPTGYYLNSSASMKDTEFNIISSDKRNLVKQNLKRLGLLGTNSHTKFIPDVYKYNSVDVRLNVLRGLVDTDGYATDDNLLQFTSVSKQLCEDVRFLVESLGGLVSYSEKPCGYNNKITGMSYTLTIRLDNPQECCILARKNNMLKHRSFKPRRNIVSVERIENADAKCITVDNSDSLYVIDHFVVTHNTKQVIDIGVAKKYQRGYKHCLIICGVNGLKWNWCNEVRTHSDEDAYILGQKVLKNGKMKIGSNEDKLNDLINFDDIKEYFIITNIETLRYKEWTGEYIKSRNGKVSKEYRYPITDRLVELCNSHDIDMIATDEVHKMKNSESDQGSQFLRLHAETMIAMTGTPLMNQPMDLFIILKWLGFESHSFYAFRNYYCNLGGFSGYEIMGYKNLDDLQARLDKIMLRRKKEDVLDLPEKTYINEYVEMTPKQSQVYKEVTMDIKANIDQVKAAANPLSALIRMRQATGYTGILSSVVKESAKLDRMEELVEESRANGKKVVIFSNWTQMTDVIYERLNSKGYGISVITGDTKDEDRQQIVDLFQNSPKCNVLIGTIGAMGTGLTLTAGTVEIFMDEPWNRALKDQAEDRCHRIGQNSNITIYTLLCKDTIDERINQLVYKKGKMSDALVDGEIKFNKSDVIDFLLD